MKTAMQELSEILVSRIDDADDELKNKLNFFHSWVIIHGIEIEKRQMEAVYQLGLKDGFDCMHSKLLK